jgi:hypothetical protein
MRAFVLHRREDIPALDTKTNNLQFALERQYDNINAGVMIESGVQRE